MPPTSRICSVIVAGIGSIGLNTSTPCGDGHRADRPARPLAFRFGLCRR